MSIKNETDSMNNDIEQLENGLTSDKIITLKGVFKGGKHTVQPAYNPTKGWWEGIPRVSEDEKKGMTYCPDKFSKLVLTDGCQFDLTNEIDVANWKWVKHLKEVAMSFDAVQNTPQAMFYVHLEGREARESNSVVEIRYKATKLIMEDSPVNYENRALILGSDLSGESPESIKKFLLEQAHDKPHLVIACYEAKDQGIRLAYLKARKFNIVEERDGVIMFGSNVMGVSDAGAIAFLQTKENSHVLDILTSEVSNRIALLNSGETAESKSAQWNFNKANKRK
jgi:hypothetical protein